MTAQPLPLSAHHRRMLIEESGISELVIQARGYRTIEKEGELVQYGFSSGQRRVPGLLLPLHGTNGKVEMHVYRPDNPRVISDRSKREADGLHPQKVIKYEIPKNTSVRVDCPPTCQPGLKNPKIPLYITEGQKKADALATHGACAIALLGVWNFKGRNDFGGTTVLADFDFIAWDNRPVRIVFDSDVIIKPQVRKALDRLTEILQRKGAEVSAIYLPNRSTGEKLGVDDWLALDHTLAELEAMAESPRPAPQAAQPIFELLDEASPVLSRPLSLIDKTAYAVTWLPLRLTIHEKTDKDGNVITLNPPKKEERLSLFVVRGDGRVFGEISDGQSCRPLSELNLTVNCPEIVLPGKRWSTKGVTAYLQGKRPDPVQVFFDVKAVINRFLDFDHSIGAQKVMAELVSCYCLATYLLEAFNVIGFLWSNGEKGSGKTNLLIVVSEISYLGQLILAGGSFASLRDLADYGATLAFDDAENLADPRQTDPDKRALLLAGNRRGSTVPLKEPSANGKWALRHVNTYCPRLFSAIHLPDSVLASRTIIIPLIRTDEREKANSDPLDYELWPCDRRTLIDSLWALGLAYLPELREHERFVSQHARLSGRNLQPWKAILATAHWLDTKDTQRRLQREFLREHDQGIEQRLVGGLYDRLEELSYRYAMNEVPEAQSGDMTQLVLRGLCQLAADHVNDSSDVKGNSDIHTTAWTFSTNQITEAAVKQAESTEADLDTSTITSRRVGRVLSKLRFTRAREGGKGTRQWTATQGELTRWASVYAFHLPQVLTHLGKVTNVTNGATSPGGLSSYPNCAVVLRLPSDSKLPTVRGQWRRLEDGRLEAGYDLEQLAIVLSLFLEKNIEASKIAEMSPAQLSERLVRVTGGEVVHIRLENHV